MNDENKNLLLAIVLSVAVIALWNFFVIEPQTRAQRAAQQAAIAAQAQPNAAPGAPGVAAPDAVVAREVALERDERVAFNTKGLKGTISLRGARIDDLTLHGFRQKLAKDSPEVQLLQPQGTQNAYWSVFGWLGAAGTDQMPGPDTLWKNMGGDLSAKTPLILQYVSKDGLKFERTITLDDDYMFTISDTVTNTGTGDRVLQPYASLRRHGVPGDLAKLMVLHEGFTGVLNGVLQERKYEKLLKGEQMSLPGVSGWLGITDKYWLAAIIPEAGQLGKAEYAVEKTGTTPVFFANFTGEPRTLAVDGTLNVTHRLFAGAKKVSVLQDYQKQLNIPNFDKAVDWGNFWVFTRPFFSLLHFFGSWTGNMGIAILLVTVVVKLALFPLVNASYESISRMKKVQPMMEEIRKRWAKDPQKQQQELVKLYAEEKINPVAGCLPMLAQIPIFYALYKVLLVTIEMRHAPFFGWIQDLSAPDPTSVFNLFGLLPYDPSSVPLIGAFLMVGIWPLLYGVSMWGVQSLNPKATDPIQAQVFAIMPWMFVFLFAGFAAGLVIYWTWSNVLSFIQQYWINRKNGVDTEIDKWIAGLRAKAKGA